MTWFIKKPNARDPWGIRVSVGSVFHATQGLGRTRAYIDKTLARLGVKFAAHQVVLHSPANRANHLGVADDLTSNGKSGRFTSVATGKMPGRQVIIYGKRREVIDKHKPIWWDIWTANLARDDLPPLNPTDAAQSRDWRIEVRAGLC